MGDLPLWPFVVAILLLVGGYFLFKSSVEHNEAYCKATYGNEYRLGSSPVNSSIQWCQAPDGTVKAL